MIVSKNDHKKLILQFPNAVAYCVSTSAIDQFTRCVALELAAKQVRVNSVKYVCPHYVMNMWVGVLLLDMVCCF